MIFLTQKNIQSNLKKFNITEVDGNDIQYINDLLLSYTTNSLKKALKKYNKNGGNGAVGRTVLPSEYFGINSGVYSNTSSGTDMSVTNTMIRPTIAYKSISGGSGAIGRTVLPSEYFGINSGVYSDTSSGTDMSVTNTMIRPVIPFNDVTKPFSGGSNNKFTISKSAFNNAITEAKVTLKINNKLEPSTVLQLKDNFEAIMTKLFKSVSKKSHNLNELNNYVKKSTYRILQ